MVILLDDVGGIIRRATIDGDVLQFKTSLDMLICDAFQRLCETGGVVVVDGYN